MNEFKGRFISHFSHRNSTLNNLLLSIISGLSNLIFVSTSRRVQIRRVLKSLRLPEDDDHLNIISGIESYPTIEILYVTHRKDFDVLKYSIESLQRVTTHHHEQIFTFVVPQLESAELRNFLPKDISYKIIEEESIVSASLRATIARCEFENGVGWIVQQLCKVAGILQSKSQGVLVVDSDTILLRPRFWFTSAGRQSLFASHEYHTPYYEFLNFFGISDLQPEYTFVTHHMLFQPEFMIKAMHQAGWHNLEDLVSAILTYKHKTKLSPVCVEYELYGQYMWNFHRNKISLYKWCNKGLPRELTLSTLEKFGTEKWLKNWNSISLQGYL